MIISQFYPLHGGAEQQALHLAKSLIKNGITVSVLTRYLKGVPVYENIEGIPVYRNIKTIAMGKLFGLTYIITVCFFLLRMRHEYDIIHCHLAQGFHSPVALLFKALFKKKVIIKVGATGPLSDFKMLQQVVFGNFFLRILKYADRIITVCAQATDEAYAYGIPHSHIIEIPNGVDIEQFYPSPERRKDNVIAFVGRLDYMKGVHVLLKAVCMLKQKCSTFYLNIIGDGPEKETLQAMAVQLGISESVLFLGETDTIADELPQAAIFALPSLSEGLSNVILEAMACGLPVIATSVGGNPDIICDGVNGLLVEPERPEQLYNALWQLLSDRAFASSLGVQARSSVEQKFSLNMVVKRYLELYHVLHTPA